MEKTFTVYKPMCSTPETEIAVSVERAEWIGRGPAEWRVTYWSDYKGIDRIEYFDEEPTDDALKAMLLESEHADDVW